jgi:hypothetical protein
MKEVLLALIVLAYVVPFAYMLISDIVDVYRRLTEVFSRRLKPAMVVVLRSFIN